VTLFGLPHHRPSAHATFLCHTTFSSLSHGCGVSHGFCLHYCLSCSHLCSERRGGGEGGGREGGGGPYATCWFLPAERLPYSSLPSPNLCCAGHIHLVALQHATPRCCHHHPAPPCRRCLLPNITLFIIAETISAERSIYIALPARLTSDMACICRIPISPARAGLWPAKPVQTACHCSRCSFQLFQRLQHMSRSRLRGARRVCLVERSYAGRTAVVG